MQGTIQFVNPNSLTILVDDVRVRVSVAHADKHPDLMSGAVVELAGTVGEITSRDRQIVRNGRVSTVTDKLATFAGKVVRILSVPQAADSIPRFQAA